MNAATMAIEAQYTSFNTARELGWPHSNSASETWPGADIGFLVIEIFFGVIFTMEVVLKLLVGPCQFVRSGWNWFDSFIVTVWIVSVFETKMLFNPMLLRLVRLVRLLRLLRLAKTVRLFDVLHVLVGSLQASAKVLCWSFVLLLGLMLAGALTLNFLVEPFLIDDSKSFEARAEVYVRFGSFSRSFVSMFEMTLGNWVPPLRLLQENVSEWYGPLLLVYVVLVNFAVVQVIRGVFMHETFTIANLDDSIMVMQRERQVASHVTKMKMLFEEADKSGDGYLSYEEFDEVSKDPRIRTWLSAMGFDVSDTPLVFELLDDGDHMLTAEELVKGVAILKGNARSIDMLSTHAIICRIEQLLQDKFKADGEKRHSIPAELLSKYGYKRSSAREFTSQRRSQGQCDVSVMPDNVFAELTGSSHT